MLKLTFNEMMKLVSMFVKMMGLFLDVQTDGVTLLVPCSSSSFSLGSVVVVGPRENVCPDMKLGSDGGTDDSTPGPLAKSAEMNVWRGSLLRMVLPSVLRYKDVRRRMRNEARRQKELDEGVEPEVVLDSFLNQVNVEQQPQSGPLLLPPKLPNILVRGTRSCERPCVGGLPTTRCVPTAIGATSGTR